MINLDKTRFTVFAWPDHRWPVETIHWLYDLIGDRNDWLAKHCFSLRKANQVCARNRAVQLALQSPHDEFVFIDADVRPGRHTNLFLDLESDVKVCQVPMKGKRAWIEPDSFHEAIWCTSRRVLESIEPPWFHHEYTDDHTEMLACICQSFRDKARASGFTIAHGGWAEHANEGTWCG